jgi:GntR family transcriptional regulator
MTSRTSSDPVADLTRYAVVDRSSPVPLYFQVAQQLEQAIESGAVPPGSRLDNEVALAEQLGLSRPTMRRALQHLVERGLLVRRRGVGTRVVQPKVRRPVQLSSLFEDLERAGQQPSTRLISSTTGPADAAVAAALGLAVGDPVRHVVRVRGAAGRPIARMTNDLPAALLDVPDDELERTGLYRLLRAGGVTLHAASQTIGARTATAAEARLLEEPRGAALLTMRRVAYDDQGRAVESGDHLYAASRYALELTLLT